MNNKQQRKLRRRARIAAIRATQDAWIADVLFVEPATRRERDALFAQARAIKGSHAAT
jgi:hypothetical protein